MYTDQQEYALVSFFFLYYSEVINWHIHKEPVQLHNNCVVPTFYFWGIFSSSSQRIHMHTDRHATSTSIKFTLKQWKIWWCPKGNPPSLIYVHQIISWWLNESSIGNSKAFNFQLFVILPKKYTQKSLEFFFWNLFITQCNRKKHQRFLHNEKTKWTSKIITIEYSLCDKYKCSAYQKYIIIINGIIRCFAIDIRWL